MTRAAFRQADIERIIRAAKANGAPSAAAVEVKHQTQKQDCRNTNDTCNTLAMKSLDLVIENCKGVIDVASSHLPAIVGID